MKPQTTNHKLQTKHKVQNHKRFGIWNLEFGVSHRGFTLLETIVALTVITAAMAGPISLATRGILSAKFAKNRLVAANLAQEGLELVRKLRDDNILAKRAWDFGIGVGDWQSEVRGPPALSVYSGAVLLRDVTSGVYNYLSGTDTLFRRRITITKPVANQMAVVSEVSWTEGGIARTMILQEILYNWR